MQLKCDALFFLIYILVVLLKLQHGIEESSATLGNTSALNHWFVDKINVITDTSENEEECNGDQ